MASIIRNLVWWSILCLPPLATAVVGVESYRRTRQYEWELPEVTLGVGYHRGVLNVLVLSPVLLEVTKQFCVEGEACGLGSCWAYREPQLTSCAAAEMTFCIPVAYLLIASLILPAWVWKRGSIAAIATFAV